MAELLLGIIIGFVLAFLSYSSIVAKTVASALVKLEGKVWELKEDKDA